jgi:hypothetical protein
MANKEEKRVEITILGKTREITLPELIELYKSIDDPSAETHARSSFRIHELAQARKEQLEKACSSPEERYKFVIGEVNAAYLGYEYGMNYHVSPIPDDVFEIAEGLSVDELERIVYRCDPDEEPTKRFQALLDAKKAKEQSEEKAPEGGNQKKLSKDDGPTI